MRLRLVTAALLTLLVAAPAADADPKRSTPPPCGILTDPAGDTSFGPVTALGGPLDIVRGEITRTKSTLVAMLRMADSVNTGRTANTLSYRWAFAGSFGGVSHNFELQYGWDGVQRAEVHIGRSPVPFRITVAGPEIVWTVRMADLPAYLSRPSAQGAGLAAVTGMWGWGTTDTAITGHDQKVCAKRSP